MMTWTLFAQLVAQYGIPFVQALVDKWKNNTAVTPDEVAALLAMAQQTSKDRMLGVLKAQGIDPASDAGKALLALTA